MIRQSLAGRTVPENVTVSMEIPETQPLIEIDPGQMRQVFQNLITNAVQAMPEGGELRIATRRWNITDEGPDKYPVSTDQSGMTIPQPADFMDITAADSGTGISPENMNKIFHPLFTTKSRGIGLGLSISKNFVEAIGGQIAVSSEPGKGTTFTVSLPRKSENDAGGEEYSVSLFTADDMGNCPEQVINGISSWRRW